MIKEIKIQVVHSMISDLNVSVALKRNLGTLPLPWRAALHTLKCVCVFST